MKEIPFDYFPINEQVTNIHASAELGRLGIPSTTETLKDMMETIDTNRRIVKCWAKMEIQAMMHKEAVAQKLTFGRKNRIVKSYKEITAAFKEDESLDGLKKIWEVTFGYFDKNPGWQKILADNFMTGHGWVYRMEKLPAKKRKYCVEQQIALTKVELVRAMNKAALKTHGKTVGISRNNMEITEKTKFKKRKKAVFQEQYIASTVSALLVLSLFVNTYTLTTIILVFDIHIASCRTPVGKSTEAEGCLVCA